MVQTKRNVIGWNPNLSAHERVQMDRARRADRLARLQASQMQMAAALSARQNQINGMVDIASRMALNRISKLA